MGEMLEKLPALGIGALIPLAAIALLLFSSARNIAYFPLILHGFATFFASVAFVAVATVVLLQSFFGAVSVSASDGDQAVMVAGAAILLILYLATEVLRYISYKNAFKKSDKKQFGGILFGAGFILAQNLLVLGVTFTGDFSMKESIGFGVLMLICGIIYLLISEIGYQTAADGHPYIGGALASAYFILLAVMLVFSNKMITYTFLVIVLLFVLVMGYVLLPHSIHLKGGKGR